MIQEQDSLPTVFHVTHHKTGSQWVAEILKCAAPDRVVLPKLRMAQFYDEPLQPGGVYLTVYVPKFDFDRVITLLRGRCLVFVVIRDLRDTMISRYFSVRYSHVMNTEYLRRARSVLNQLRIEEGLLMMIGQGENSMTISEFASFLPSATDEYIRLMTPHEFSTYLSLMTCYHACIQLSWILASEALLIRYEDLIHNEHAVFSQIIQHCQINISSKRLKQIVVNNSFAKVTGRKPGQEDILAHQRKGIVGDWRNHFTDRVKDAFKQRFGDVLIKTGYEQNMDW